MKSKTIFIIFFTIVFLFIVGVFLHHQKVEMNSGPKKYSVVCTTSMIADAVQKIVGDTMSVHCLMGPGVDPHLYRAREGDMHLLASADIIFYNGLHLEGKMADVFEAMASNKKIVCVADGIDKNKLLKSEFEEVYDPHIWHDVSLWMDVLKLIMQKLIEVDSSFEQRYTQNMHSYYQELSNLHATIKSRLFLCDRSSRILITAHDAFRYFGRAYDVEVVGLQGISTDAEVGIQDVVRLADYIVEHKVRFLFVESCLPRRNIQAVQNAVKARGWSVEIGDVLYSDALGDSDGVKTYKGMMEHNLEALLSAFFIDGKNT